MHEGVRGLNHLQVKDLQQRQSEQRNARDYELRRRRTGGSSAVPVSRLSPSRQGRPCVSLVHL
jgi:hypothetical protein